MGSRALGRKAPTQVALGLLVGAIALSGCGGGGGGGGGGGTSSSSSTSTALAGICGGGAAPTFPAPAFVIGSKGQDPTVGVVPVVPPASPFSTQLIVTTTGAPDFSFDYVTPVGDAFEMCVATSPPVVSKHLGSIVEGTLLDPSAAAGAPSGAVDFWQRVFGTYFLNPLQDQQTSADGVLRVIVPAQAIRNELVNSPPGYSTGAMRIKIALADGVHVLILTLGKR